MHVGKGGRGGGGNPSHWQQSQGLVALPKPPKVGHSPTHPSNELL